MKISKGTKDAVGLLFPTVESKGSPLTAQELEYLYRIMAVVIYRIRHSAWKSFTVDLILMALRTVQEIAVEMHKMEGGDRE